MEFIITAGATSEAIDTVRSITNHATGTLGCKIAQKLYEKEKDWITKIYYICESSAVKPDLPCVETRLVHGTAETAETIQDLLTSRQITAMVHSMAVSDYAVHAAVDFERLADVLEKKLQKGSQPVGQAVRSIFYESLSEVASFSRQEKMSSDVEHLLLVLQKTPKIIGMVKKLSPKTKLVGFKLLDHVPQEKLIDTAYALLLRNNCDFVLANDLQSIQAGKHTGYLIEPGRIVTIAEGKDSIAELIADKLLTAVRQGGNG